MSVALTAREAAHATPGRQRRAALLGTRPLSADTRNPLAVQHRAEADSGTPGPKVPINEVMFSPLTIGKTRFPSRLAAFLDPQLLTTTHSLPRSSGKHKQKRDFRHFFFGRQKKQYFTKSFYGLRAA